MVCPACYFCCRANQRGSVARDLVAPATSREDPNVQSGPRRMIGGIDDSTICRIMIIGVVREGDCVSTEYRQMVGI